VYKEKRLGMPKVFKFDLKMPCYFIAMDEYTQFVLDEAKFHMRAAEELLTESIKDPEKHYRETKRFHADLAKLFPFMVLLKSFEPPLPDPETEDNLSDTQSSVSSDEDSYVPATPPRRSES